MIQINPIRTADELKDSSYNYFIAFKIDLKETYKAKIESQIKKILCDPKGDVQSRRWMELRKDIMEIMCNDSVYNPESGEYQPNAGGRAKEAEAAKDFRLKEALDLVQILCTTRKTLLKSEIRKIYDSANSPIAYFTEVDFYNAMKPLIVGVKIVDNLDASMPFDKYKKTEQFLKPLDKKDLYDFLGCKITDSEKELQEKQNAQYKYSQDVRDLKKKQAISGLCGYTQELLLSSPESRKNYDNFLALKDDVWSEFEKRKAFGVTTLTTDEYEMYAQKIIDTLHIDADEAKKMLAIACKFFQITVQANPVRTANELKDPSFNYFIAFKINLKETDRAIIGSQIKRVLSDPKGSVQYRRLLELKNDIMEVMCNDSVYNPESGEYQPNAGGRAKEAEAAKAFRLKEALDLIQILCATRKVLLRSEIKKIYDSANSPVVYFTEADFDNAIKPLLAVGIKIIDNLDTSIPFDKYQKTEQLLKPLDKKNLYDFIECDITASEKELKEKKDAQYKNSPNGDLKKKQAISGLCSYVQELLLSSLESRKNYDNYLALKDNVWSEFEKRKRFGIKELTIDEYRIYAQKIINTLHIGVDEAEKMLAVACKFFQFTIVGA